MSGLQTGDHGRQLLKQRFYRVLHQAADLVHYRVAVKETDLYIGVRKESYRPALVLRTEELVRQWRQQLEEYIASDPGFVTSLVPYPVPEDAPPLVRTMAEAAALAGVGPMAAVAGAIAQAVGSQLARFSRDVIVENGGDIYLRSQKIRLVAVYAGSSPFSNRLALEIRPEISPLGICTSSGTVGHSLSFGRADAVVILARCAALADAVATAAGNIVKTPDDLVRAVEFACAVEGVYGALAIIGDKMAAKGQIKLRPLF